MSTTLKNKDLQFRHKSISSLIYNEVVHDNNPEDWDLARPLFDTGVFRLAIIERKKYGSGNASRVYHTLTLPLQGKMVLNINQHEYSFGPGELAYTPPETKFQRIGTEPIRILLIDILDTKMWHPLKQRGAFVRTYEHAVLMFVLTRSILDARASRGPSVIILAHQNSIALLNLLKHEMSGIKSPALRYRSQLQQLIDSISRCPEQAWTVPQMASQLHMSTSLLTKLFRREYNQSPMELVISHRVQKATDLLKENDNTIENISQAVGYHNVYSFIRLFKKHMGISPGQYRRRAVSQLGESF